jgi:hypothetical protein
MAVSKLWAVDCRLDQVIDYAANPDKTEKITENNLDDLQRALSYVADRNKTANEFYVSGINCIPGNAFNQFQMIKKRYGKTNGVQAYHGYLSFEKGSVTPEHAHEIGLEYARRLWGERFQVIVTTHLDTEHIHDHFVINSVSFSDGKKLHGREKAWFYFHHIADEVCKEYGLGTIENPQRAKNSDYLTMKERAGVPTRYTLIADAIDEAISNSRTMKEFERYLYKMGYKYNFNPNHKYWTVTPKGWDKPVRLYRLGDNYTNENIRRRIEEQDIFRKVTPFHPAHYVPNEHYDPRKAKGSLYNLYLYYCYRLGAFEKQKQNKKEYNRMHYLLREDLMNAEKYSQEARLLGKNHIDTAEQLFSYKQSLTEKNKALTDARKDLRNKLRRVGNTEVDLQKIRADISQISDTLKELRKELSLCDDIAERSHIIEENVEQITADEERAQTKSNKEVERNEQFR